MFAIIIFKTLVMNISLKEKIKNLVFKSKLADKIYKQRFIEDHYFSPENCYSPLVVAKVIESRKEIIWPEKYEDTIPDIELNEDIQKQTFSIIEKKYSEGLDFCNSLSNEKFTFNNPYFSISDGIILYSLLSNLKPKKIIEIGAGYSSYFIQEIKKTSAFKNSFDYTVIEPNTDIFKSLADNLTDITLFEEPVQSVPLEVFKTLVDGDILYLDTSHIVKTGSEVNHILFNILPTLNKGVIIHFDDVYYPFDYKKELIEKGYSWNENYFLRAFLMNNNEYRIKLFTDYLFKIHADLFTDFPDLTSSHNADLWLEKI